MHLNNSFEISETKNTSDTENTFTFAQQSVTKVSLLYEVQCFIGIAGTDKLITSHAYVRLFMIISHVKIIAFQTITNHSFWIFFIGRKDCSLYNKQKNSYIFST